MVQLIILNKNKIISFLILLFLVTCCDVTENGEEPLAYVEISVLADGFGNHDGIAQDEEITSIIDFFNTHDEAWGVSGISLPYRDTTVNEIPVEELPKMVGSAEILGPYYSEEAFIDHFENIKIQTPWIGIYVFETKNEKYYISRFFRSPGTKVGDNSYWTEFEIY